MRRQGDHNMNGKFLSLLAVLALASFEAHADPAQAHSYRCVGKDGKRYYGSTIPRECYGLPVEQLNAQGMLVKRVDPVAEEKQRLAKEAAEARKREQEAAAREAARRNQALLATYTSEKDIDEARARALADNTKATRDVEARIDEIRKRHSAYEKELSSYKGKGEPPAKLREDLHSAESELKVHEQLLEAKKREVEAINTRYDEDKKRYAQITRGR
jgi:hypothetical protein